LHLNLVKVRHVARVILPFCWQRSQTQLSMVLSCRASLTCTTMEAITPSAKQILQTIIAGAQSI